MNTMNQFRTVTHTFDKHVAAWALTLGLVMCASTSYGDWCDWCDTHRPTSVVSGSATICDGSATTIQAVLTGIGPWDLTWSDGTHQNHVNSSPATRSVSPSVTTTYTVTALNDDFCTAYNSDRTGSAVVTVNAIPAAPTASNNGPISAGETLNLSASTLSLSTVSPVTYSWTGPNGFTSSDQNPSISNATTEASGTYTVTVTVNGCTSAGGTTIVTVNNIAPSIMSLELTVSAVSTGEVDLSWNNIVPGMASLGVKLPSVAVTTSYGVFRDGTQMATTIGTNYSDTGLVAGSNYCYVVVAYDIETNILAQSAEECAQTFVTPGSLRGTYDGLVIQTNAPTHESSGLIKLVISGTGSFDASLTMGGVVTVFNGSFDAAGDATKTIMRRRLHPLQVILHLDVAGDSEQITGTVSDDGLFTSELLANREVFSRTNPCSFAGHYTIVLVPLDGDLFDGLFTPELLANRETVSRTNPSPLAGDSTVALGTPDGDSANVPLGDGYGSITVSTVGDGNMSGMLSDGTRITTNSAPVSKYGTWPLYIPLYKKQGSCIGWVLFATNGMVRTQSASPSTLIGWGPFTTNDVAIGAVNWFKPAMRSARYYPSGFVTNVMLMIGEKNVPSAGVPSPVGDRLVILGLGNLTNDIIQAVSIDAAGTITVPPPNSQNLKMKLQPSTGLFSGSFKHPVLGRKINFKGALFQSDYSGAGYFLGTNESGFVTLELPLE